MSGELQKTYAMIKPDAVAAGNAQHILDRIEAHGFVILAKEQLHLSRERAGQFYEEHRGRPFYPALVEFMSSGPIYALVLAKQDAIVEWRTLMGPTDSNKARDTHPSSIRALFGTNNQRNATHGSDSPSSAAREIKFFFPHIHVGPVMTGEVAKDYLTLQIQPTLTQGLIELCKTKPENPVKWLAHYLLDNNPNKPRVTEA
eukprot:TRINITY_DN1419_c0_g1_i2.p1 TRINITY_DN1419_c0_g1~~TRINITY_DN1419_c0_g1_i2.p1  ORF type:complete len:201 (-),score=44.41 TRINITY_DN1419_c0_g1_i2:382-984(-)